VLKKFLDNFGKLEYNIHIFRKRETEMSDYEHDEVKAVTGLILIIGAIIWAILYSYI